MLVYVKHKRWIRNKEEVLYKFKKQTETAGMNTTASTHVIVQFSGHGVGSKVPEEPAQPS